MAVSELFEDVCDDKRAEGKNHRQQCCVGLVSNECICCGFQWQCGPVAETLSRAGVSIAGHIGEGIFTIFRILGRRVVFLQRVFLKLLKNKRKRPSIQQLPQAELYESLEPPSKFKILNILFGIPNMLFEIPNMLFGIPFADSSV